MGGAASVLALLSEHRRFTETASSAEDAKQSQMKAGGAATGRCAVEKKEVVAAALFGLGEYTSMKTSRPGLMASVSTGGEGE